MCVCVFFLGPCPSAPPSSEALPCLLPGPAPEGLAPGSPGLDMVYGPVVIALSRIKIAQACLALCLQLLGELGGCCWRGWPMPFPAHQCTDTFCGLRAYPGNQRWGVVWHGGIRGPVPASRRAAWALGRLLHNKKHLLSNNHTLTNPAHLLLPLSSPEGGSLACRGKSGSPSGGAPGCFPQALLPAMALLWCQGLMTWTQPPLPEDSSAGTSG